MTDRASETTDDLPRFVDITARFYREFKHSAEKLDAAGERLDQNKEVADALYPDDPTKHQKLCRCHRRYASNNPNDLEPLYYCRDWYCYFCDELRAGYRANQVLEASRLYAAALKTTKLTNNQFVVHPTPSGLRNPVTGLQTDFQRLNEFADQVKQWRHNQNAIITRAVAAGRRLTEQQKAKTLGPVTATIHMRKDEHGIPRLHLHLGVVHYVRRSKRNLHQELGGFWWNLQRNHGVDVNDYSAVTLDDTKHASGEVGKTNFNPADLDTQTQVNDRFRYLGRTFSDERAAEELVRECRWWKRLAIHPKNLYRVFLGPHMSVERQELPHNFTGLIKHKRFIAKYDRDRRRWQVGEQCS